MALVTSYVTAISITEAATEAVTAAIARMRIVFSVKVVF